MKVMVIDDSQNIFNGKPPFVDGEVVTATQSPVYEDNYVLAEYPFSPKGVLWSFGKHRFIPLSDIDETEMVREYNLEKIS